MGIAEDLMNVLTVDKAEKILNKSDREKFLLSLLQEIKKCKSSFVVSNEDYQKEIIPIVAVLDACIEILQNKDFPLETQMTMLCRNYAVMCGKAVDLIQGVGFPVDFISQPKNGSS